VSEALGVDAGPAADLVTRLRLAGYLEQDRDVPTPLGMALAAAKRRPRISRAMAEDILQRVLRCAAGVNAQSSARFTVSSIDVFGSYLSNSQDLGDLDLLLEFVAPDDLRPEDFDERDRICKKLCRISAYVSMHNEFDYIAAGAPMKRVFQKS